MDLLAAMSCGARMGAFEDGHLWAYGCLGSELNGVRQTDGRLAVIQGFEDNVPPRGGWIAQGKSTGSGGSRPTTVSWGR